MSFALISGEDYREAHEESLQPPFRERQETFFAGAPDSDHEGGSCGKSQDSSGFRVETGFLPAERNSTRPVSTL